MKYRISKEKNGNRGSVDANRQSNEFLLKFIDSMQRNIYKDKAKKVLAQRGVTV